ncbi:HdaA/DnaA family protein [Ahrensia kielensis]|uniref:HdaA/DnaA family protein n=1 Tax=Ahrensia kielensis TaxID=76980 RepID=UPI0003737EF5|nr:DnaA/Hda family protein [Ahrensia kielensis]
MVEANQLLLDLRGAPSLTRDDLVVSAANLNAASLIDNWPHWPSPWAVLIGAKGYGKSHLAEIWCEAAQAHRVNPSELSDVDLDEAQKGRPILIDGLSEGNFDETRTFHLMNAVRNAQQTMLITAENNPALWRLETADLRSRFKAATTVEIGEPDDALLRAVLAKLFADRQINVGPDIVEYLATRIDRSLGSANHVVNLLDREALMSKARITKPLIARVLETIDSE